MKSKVISKDFSIRVNDIFEELSEENNRLNNKFVRQTKDLMFANNCLKILNKFKSHLNKIYVKYQNIIDFEDKQELNQLENEFNSVIKSKEETIKTDDENRDNVREIDENSNNLSEELSEEENDSNETNVRRSGRTDRKVNAIPVKRKPKPKTETKPKPLLIEIPEPEEQPNSLLLLRRNNFDAKTQSYVCPNPYCDKSFPTDTKLYQHFRFTHHAIIKHFCEEPNCGKGFKTLGKLRNHSLTHSDYRPFVCPFEGCEYKSKLKQALDQHLVIHSEVRSYKCSECEKTFKLKASFVQHMKQNHSTRPAFKCVVEGCHQKFRKSNDLIKHKRNEHNLIKTYSCGWPGCEYESTYLGTIKSHRKLHKTKKGYVFKPKVTEIPEPEEQPNSLLLMQRNNFDAKTQSYVCPNPYCHKSFPTNQNLYQHFHSIHHSINKYFCEEPNCGKGFKTRTELKTHSIVHSEDKPFVCSFEGCEFKSKNRYYFNKHLVSHSETYICNECEKTFKFKTSFLRHMKNNHSTRPAFECRVQGCHQWFSKSCQLFRHKVIEHNLMKRYSCDWPGCDYQTTCCTRFKGHKALHTGRKDYVCEWPGCGKRFRTLNLKYIHTLVHKNEKRYSCDWPGCEYRANVLSNVKQHKKWNHK